MKYGLSKCISTCAVILAAANVNAVPQLFQGSSDPSSTLTTAEARTAWEAALSSFIIDDLNSVSGFAPLSSSVGNVYTETGNGSRITGTGSSIKGNRSTASFIQFDVTFTNPVNAVGFDVSDNDGGGMDLLLTDANTGVVSTFNFTSTPGSGDYEFFGVVFDTSTFISSLRVSGTDPGGITYWDNFTTGVGQNAVNPVDVSEPGTLALFGLSLAALGFTRRKKF